mmetsp:Transcript_6773/g.20055  ORF Transcript_6773/g.20055 Transcript_6773/m.20055 type:complete len:245 (-) Transcript_6773:1309-2043(-)
MMSELPGTQSRARPRRRVVIGPRMSEAGNSRRSVPRSRLCAAPSGVTLTCTCCGERPPGEARAGTARHRLPRPHRRAPRRRAGKIRWAWTGGRCAHGRRSQRARAPGRMPTSAARCRATACPAMGPGAASQPVPGALVSAAPGAGTRGRRRNPPGPSRRPRPRAGVRRRRRRALTSPAGAGPRERPRRAPRLAPASWVRARRGGRACTQRGPPPAWDRWGRRDRRRGARGGRCGRAPLRSSLRA